MEQFASYEEVWLSESETRELTEHLATALAAAETSAASAHHLNAMWPALFPWVARFAPHATTSALNAAYWKFAINCENPAGAVLSTPLVPLPTPHIDGIAALVEERVTRALGRTNFDYVVSRAYEVVLLSATEEQIVRWLKVGIHTPCRKNVDAWQILPVPHMLEILATPGLASMVWKLFQKESSAPSSEPKNRASIYWLEIYVYCVTGNDEAATQALEQLRALPTDHPWAISWIRIVARSRNGSLLDAMLEQPDLRKHLASDRSAHDFSWFLRVAPSWRPRLGLAEMLTTLHPNLIATLVGLLSDEDQVRYARCLAEDTFRRIAHATAKEDPSFRHRWIIDEHDNLKGWDLGDDSNTSGGSHSALSSVWGVNRNESGFFNTLKERAGGVSRESQAERQVDQRNAALDQRSDFIERLDRRQIRFFRATRVLQTWARRHPSAFGVFCREYFAVLDRTSNFGVHLEMSGFSEGLLNAWGRVDLDGACTRRARGAGCSSYGSGTQVWVEGVIPIDRFHLMAESVVNASSARTWRMKALEDAETDREILQCVQAAMMGGCIGWIREIARHHYGTSSLAKERALAVSLLAFAGESEDDILLGQWAESDASYWVREHAEWAQRVRRQVRTAETRWAEIRELAAQVGSRVEVVATKLAFLGPILPPTALAWQRGTSPEPRVAALIHAFWD